MSKKTFLVVCTALVAVIALDGLCVYVHDLDRASDAAKEGSFLKLGHFEWAWIEDVIAVGLIGLAALTFKGSCARSMFCSGCLCIAGLLLGIEFFGQLGILTTEDQTVLSSAGSITRVFGVLLSALASSVSFIMGLSMAMPAPTAE